MKYFIENNNYPMNKILENLAIFELLYPTNTKLINNCNIKNISENSLFLNFYINDISDLGLDNFNLNVKVKRKIENNKIIYKLKNINDELENIQFNKFNINIIKFNNNKYNIEIEYDINKKIYNKMFVNLFNKIIVKIFKNLEESLNKLYKK